MGIFDGFEVRETSGIINPSQWLLSLLGAQPEVASGVTVNHETAIRQVWVYQSVRFIADTVSTLPPILYETITDDGKEKAKSHRLYNILKLQPNPEITAAAFWRTMAGHLVLRGNAYANIEENARGQVVALWIIPPDRMTVERLDGNRINYRVSLPNGEVRNLHPESVLHFSGWGYDGLIGYSPITMCAEAIGLGIAMEEFSATFYGQGAHPGLVVTHEGELSTEGHTNLESSLNKQYSGLGKAHRLMLLDEGMQLEKVGISQQDAEFIDTMKFRKVDICTGIFKIPPSLVGEMDRANHNKAESMNREFLTYCLNPILVELEQRCMLRLLTRPQRERYTIEFLRNAIVQANMNDRFDAYDKAIQGGLWMVPNDARRRENLPPLPGGDVLLRPLNMAPATENPHAEKAKEKEDKQDRSVDVRDQYRAIFRHQLYEVVAREKADIERAYHRGNVNDEWLGNFFDGHAEFFGRKLGSAIESLGVAVGTEVDAAECTRNLAIDWCRARHTEWHTATQNGSVLATAESRRADEILDRAITLLRS